MTCYNSADQNDLLYDNKRIESNAIIDRVQNLGFKEKTKDKPSEIYQCSSERDCKSNCLFREISGLITSYLLNLGNENILHLVKFD